MSICGSACSVTIDGESTFQGHRFTINTASPQIDVRAFSSGDYGSWISCLKEGSIDIDSYELASGIESGDSVDIVCTIASTPAKTLTANDCVCTKVTVTADAKDVCQISMSFQLSGDITGW